MLSRSVHAFFILTAFLMGCVGTRTCPNDQRYINGACRPVDLDGATDAADAADAGPCGVCASQTPVCDESQTPARCVECIGNSDCSGARGVCLDNVCVQCTVADESACGANVCDPTTNACTDRMKASKQLCQACVADSECIAGALCVPMRFQGVDLPGGYCLQRAAGSCPGAFRTMSSRTTLSNVESGELCGLNEALTTCRALMDHEGGTDCSSDDMCGLPGIDDGVCLTAGGECTYRCSGGNECRPVGYQCRTEEPRVCTGA